MFSKHCFDEDCGEEPFWAFLDVKMLMPHDLFGWVTYPWWSKDILKVPPGKGFINSVAKL